MDDGMDSDEDLLLARSSFSHESLLPNSSIGSIVDGILKEENLGQQNSERNVVDQSRGTETLHWKSVRTRDEKKIKVKGTLYFVVFLDKYFCKL